MKAPRPDPESLYPPSERFRRAIARAMEEGATPDDLVLRLTRGDAAKLKRHRTLPVQDISFIDGQMRYLGVKVVEGDTEASALVVG